MPPTRGRTCRPLAVNVGPAGSAGVEMPEVFRVDLLVEGRPSKKSSSSEYVYFSFFPRVRPS